MARLDVLLGVVPGAAAVVEDGGEQDAGDCADHQHARHGLIAEEEADGDRRGHRDDAREHHLAEGGSGRDVDDAGVVRPAGVVHDPGDLAELAPDFDDDRLSGRADCPDGQRAEEVDEHRGDEGRDEDVDVGQVDRGHEVDVGNAGLDLVAQDQVDLVDVGGEEEEGGQGGRRDGVALGQSLGRVADSVEAVGDVPGACLGAAELGDAAGVVGDRAEGVHRQDVGGRHEHAHGRDGGAEDAADVLAGGVDQAGL